LVVFDITGDFRRYRTISEPETVFKLTANPSSKAARLPSKQPQEAKCASSYTHNLGREQHRFLLKLIRIEPEMRITDTILDGTGASEWYFRQNTGGAERQLPQYRRIEATESEVVQATQRASDVFRQS